MIKLTLLLLLPVFCVAQNDLVKRTLLNGKVELSVPAVLKPMTDQLWSFKYHSSKKPPLALSDDNGEVNLLGSYTDQPLKEDSVLEFASTQLEYLQKSHPEVERKLTIGLHNVNGRKIGSFRVIIQAKDQKVFLYFFFMSLNGKAFRFSFNCPESLREKWEEKADDILESVKVN